MQHIVRFLNWHILQNKRKLRIPLRSLLVNLLVVVEVCDLRGIIPKVVVDGNLIHKISKIIKILRKISSSHRLDRITSSKEVTTIIKIVKADQPCASREVTCW